MADFDFTQLKGRMAQAGKGGHVELSDLERNALIDSAMEGGGEVDTDKIVDGAVTAPKIADSSITTEKLADKQYQPIVFSGMGQKHLKKNVVGGQNILTSAMVSDANTIYHIQYDYDLNGQTITLLAGSTLSFEGGSLSNGTIVGNGTSIIGNKSIFNGVTLSGTYSNEHFDLEWFITSDIDASLSNLAASCNNCSKKMFIPSGTYTFTTPIELDGTFDVQCVGTLNYDGPVEAAAITFGTEETISQYRSVEIQLSQETFPSCTINTDKTATCPDNIGVLFYNIYTSRISIKSVTNFCYGVKVVGKNNGACYNAFYLQNIMNCYQALTLMSEEGGWVNENLFLNGRFWSQSIFSLKSVARGIVIDSTANYLNNNNVFVKPCVEGLYIGLDFLYATKNFAFGVRNEGNTINVRSNYSNNFVILYNNTGVNISAGSVVISISEFKQYRLQNYLVFDSGVFTYAKDGNGNITLGNIGFADGSRYVSSSIDDYGYIYGGNYYIDITRGEATDFIIKVDGSIRLVFNTFDENGNDITTEGDIISGGVNIPFSSNVNGLLVGAAIDSFYDFYVKNDNVKIVRAGIRKIGSTQFFLKRFSIYSTQSGSKANTTSPYPTLPSIPINSNGLSFVSNTNTIAYTDNVLVGWELQNGNWVNKLIPCKYVYDFQRYVSNGTYYCVDGLQLWLKNSTAVLTPNSSFENYANDFSLVNGAISTARIAIKFFKLHGEREFWIKLDTLAPSEFETNRPKIIIIGYDANMNQISIDNMTVTTETNVRYWEASGSTSHIKQENNHTIILSQSGMVKFNLVGNIDSIALCVGVGIYEKMTLFSNCMEVLREMPLTLPSAPTAQGTGIAYGDNVLDVVNHVPYYWDGAWRMVGGNAT